MYSPPNPNRALSKNSERIEARLNTASIVPVMEIQFFMDDGNFIDIF